MSGGGMISADEPVVQAASVKPEMSLIEKVKLMSDLANACQNTQVVAEIMKLPSGDRIFKIFVEAVDRELQDIMNGKKEDVPKEVINTVNMARQLQGTLTAFQTMVSGFMGTPLVQVLNMMNQNLGGKGFQVPQSQPQQQQLEVQPYRQPPQQQQQQSYDNDDREYSGRRSPVVGLGGY